MGLRDEIVGQKQFARLRRSEDLDAADAAHMPVEIKQLLIGSLEGAQILVIQVRITLLAGIARPDERHIREVDVQQILIAPCMPVVARQNREPGREEIYPFL